MGSTTTIVRRTAAEDEPARSARGEPLSADDVKRYDLFANVSKALLEKNPGSVWLREYEPGEYICRQGEYGSTAFCVVSGKVRVYIDPAGKRDGGGNDSARPGPVSADAVQRLDRVTLDVTLGPGDFFGEMTCLSFLPRSAHVVALEPVYCLEMLRNILFLIFKNDEQKRWRSEKREFLRANSGQKFATPRPPDTPVQSVYRQRALSNELRACPLFSDVPQAMIDKLVEAADFVSVEPGEIIFREGDVADELYLVRRGFVKVARDSFGSELVLNYLSRGQYFGEIALLNEYLGRPAVRTATCSAIDHADLIVLDKEDCDELVKQYPQFAKQLEETSRQHQPPLSEQPALRQDFDLPTFLKQELMQGTSLLLFDLDRCTRCDECVRACADSHGGVSRLRREGLRFDKYFVPTSCRSCRDPVCLTECPVGSIGRSPSGAIIIEDWCIGCRKCEQNCPYGNIEMHLFEVDGETKIHKQQEPVRLARVRFEPADGFDWSCLPGGMQYDPAGGWLTFADVSGAAGEEEILAYSDDAAYQRAAGELLRQAQTRVPLPVLPGDFKPGPEIESVVKMKRANKAEPQSAALFRGIVGGRFEQQYLAASQDPNYRKAVEQARNESRGMKAVLSKAVVCDLCESVQQTPNCVYACPHDAAFRVDAGEFFRNTASSPARGRGQG